MGSQPITRTKRRRRITGAAFALLGAFCVFAWSAPAAANITVAEYMTLRAEAMSGNKGAEARWRYYVIGLMDGVQAVQAPAAAAGTALHFCMPDTLPLSPKFLDGFIQEAIGRRASDGTLRDIVKQPMAVLVAVELKRVYPCE